ncbi:MAG: GtrA family protein, partial [Oscillospiraceae bacterium]|nr:GtrA family protein [Oscillospiraceae bacterium]
MKKTIFQLIKFGIVGVVAAIVDVGVLVALRELLKLDVLLSSAVSFSVSVVVNYFLSMRFVFKGKKQGVLREFVIFVVLSVGGLGLNQLIMWLGVKFLPLH